MSRKKIETLEQREKALEWMVEMANHPLDPVNTDEYTKKVYEITSAQVQEFNKKIYAGSEYPPAEEKAEPKNIDLSDWL